ncbi:MAG: tetratricopeptide repeat protein [Pseudomonadota bacterium]
MRVSGVFAGLSAAVAMSVTVALAPPAAADVYDDCNQAKNTRLAINACSEIINRGRSTVEELVAAHSNRGATFADLGSYERALADYARALELNPRHANTMFNRANTYCALGRPDSALPGYLQAIDAGTHAAEALQRHLISLGDYQGEVDGKVTPAFKTAIETWVRRDCRT